MMDVTKSDYIYDPDNPQGYKNAMGKYKTDQEWLFISRFLTQKPMRILDIGGGSGRFAVPLAKLGHYVTVIDTSAQALALMARHNLDNIDPIHGDFMLHDVQHQYDLALTIEIETPEEVNQIAPITLESLFSKIQQSLKPNGVFISTQLNQHSWRYKLRLLKEKQAGEDIFQYIPRSPKQYRQVIQQSGFKNYEMEGFVWMPFSAIADSALVPVFAWFEKYLGLKYWLSQSPWLLIAAIK